MEIDTELESAALKAFNPLTFLLVTSTPNLVNVELLIDALKQNIRFGKEIIEIDVKKLLEGIGGNRNLTTKAPGFSTKQNSSTLLDDTNRNCFVANLIRKELVRLAVKRELARREAVTARQKEVDELVRQYLEDGLSEEESRVAAEEDLKDTDILGEDDEDDEAIGVSDPDGGHRSKLFLCIRGYTNLNSLDQLVSLYDAQVPVDVLFNVQSSVPLYAPSASERKDGTGERQGARYGAKALNTGTSLTGVGSGSAKRGTKIGEFQPEIPLFEQVKALQQDRRRDKGFSLLSGVLVCDYKFPTESFIRADGTSIIPPAASLAEGIHIIFQKLRRAEFLLYRYRVWAYSRRVIEVPAYAPPRPLSPRPNSILNVLGRPLITEAIDQESNKPASVNIGKLKSHVASKKQPNVVNHVSTEPSATIEPDEDVENRKKKSPLNMAEVSVRCIEYAQSVETQIKDGNFFSVSTFVQSCIHQSCCKDVHLLSTSELHERMLSNAKDNAIAQVMNNWHKINGSVFDAHLTPSDDKSDTCLSQGNNNLCAQDHKIEWRTTRGAEIIEAHDTLLLTSLVKKALSQCPHFLRQLHAPLNKHTSSLSQPLLSENAIGESLAYILVNTGSHLEITPSAANESHRQGWCACPRVSCGSNYSCWVDVYFRGDGTQRTQHIVHNFTQRTTFPMYVACWEFCLAEDVFFYPPPPDSDADDDSPEEQTDSEEEQTDEESIITEDGHAEKCSKLRPKEASLAPSQDHLRLYEESLLRRRVYEDICLYIHEPKTQELECCGLGSGDGVEMVDWMFLEDGCTVELRRMCGNTRQLVCNLSHFGELHCGYVFTEGQYMRYEEGDAKNGTPIAITQAQIPSNVQCFVTSGVTDEELVTLHAEVVVDVTAEVALEVYKQAVVAAKEDAKVQYEALTSRPTRNSRSREKSSSKPVNLADIEQACISAIPKPALREPMPPTMELSAVLKAYHCTALFQPHNETVQLSPDRPQFLGLSVCIWKEDHLEILHVRSFQHMIWTTAGFVEVISDDAEGYRIILGCKGSYMTTNPGEGVCLWVDVHGRCLLRKADGSQRYTVVSQLQSSSNVCLEPPLQNSILTKREDGIDVVRDPSLRITHVFFKRKQVYVERQEGAALPLGKEGDANEVDCAWFVHGLPIVKCSQSQRRITIQGMHSQDIQFDLNHHTLALTRGDNCKAVMDWESYEMRVFPVPSVKSVYIFDCAFGGLYGEVCSPPDATTHVYRVSPLGRCSEEVNGKLVLPDSYQATQEPQSLVMYKEVLNPFFVEAFQNTGVRDRVPSYMQSSDILSCFSFNMEAKFVKKSPCGSKAWDDKTPTNIFSTPLHAKDLLRCELHARDNAKNTTTFYFLSPLAMANFVSRWCYMGGKLSIGHPHRRNTEQGSSGQRTCYLLTADRQQPFHFTTTRTSTEGHTPKNDIQMILIDQGGTHGEWDIKTLEALTDLQPRSSSLEDVSIKSPINQKCGVVNSDIESLRDVVVVETYERAQSSSTPDQSKDERDRGDQRENCLKHGRLNYWHSLRNQPTLFMTPLPTQKATCETTIPETHETKIVAPQVLDVKDPLGPNPEILAGTAPRAQIKEAPFQERIPLMHSRFPNQVLYETIVKLPSDDRVPQLRVSPDICEFGKILAANRYRMLFYVTNISTIPCRYRVTAAVSIKSYLSLSYSKKFLAPGLTGAVEVVITGLQQPGETEVELQVSYEGGSKNVTIHWITLEDTDNASPLSKGVTYLGRTPPQLQRGSFTHRETSEPNEMSESTLSFDNNMNIILTA